MEISGIIEVIPIIAESRMACLYFAISGQAEMARCLSLMAQTLFFNGLALSPLNFVILQYILMLFPITSVSRWLFLFPRPCLFNHWCHTYIQIHQIPINSRAGQSGTWKVCSDAKPWRLKTFYLEPDLLLGQALCSRIYLPRAQKAGCEESTWYFCVILNFLQFGLPFIISRFSCAYGC